MIDGGRPFFGNKNLWSPNKTNHVGQSIFGVDAVVGMGEVGSHKPFVNDDLRCGIGLVCVGFIEFLRLLILDLLLIRVKFTYMCIWWWRWVLCLFVGNLGFGHFIQKWNVGGFRDLVDLVYICLWSGNMWFAWRLITGKTVFTQKCKLTHKFPLYAKVGEKRDTNLQKVTPVFSLYAKMVEKVNQNREKRASGKKREMTHYFPLICKSGEISWPKCVFFDLFFSLICILCENCWPKSMFCAIRVLTHNFPLICKTAQISWPKCSKNGQIFSLICEMALNSWPKYA